MSNQYVFKLSKKKKQELLQKSRSASKASISNVGVNNSEKAEKSRNEYYKEKKEKISRDLDKEKGYNYARNQFIDSVDNVDDKTYNMYYNDYLKATEDYKKKLRSDKLRSAWEFVNVFDDVTHKQASESFWEASNKRKAVKKEAYDTELEANTRLLENEHINKYIKTIVDYNDSVDEFVSKSNSNSGENSPAMQKDYDKLTDMQKQADEAERYLEKMGLDVSGLKKAYKTRRNNQRQEEIDEQTKQLATAHPVLASAASVPANISPSNLKATIQGVATGIGAAVKDEYIPVDTTTENFAATNFAGNVRGQVSKNIENKNEKTGKALSALYQTGMSMADSASVMLAPGKVGSLILASSAAASTIKDAADKGLNSSQAALTGIAAGAAEAIFESVSIGNLKGMTESELDSFVKATLKQMTVEGSEEAFTEISNIVTDLIINTNESDVLSTYNQYIKAGFTASQAKKKTAGQLALRVGESAIGGALSGGVFGAAAGTFNHMSNSALGKEIKNDTEQWHNIIASAKALEGTKSAKTAEKMTSGKKVSNESVGILFRQIENDITDKFAKVNTVAEAEKLYDTLSEKTSGVYKEKIALESFKRIYELEHNSENDNTENNTKNEPITDENSVQESENKAFEEKETSIAEESQNAQIKAQTKPVPENPASYVIDAVSNDSGESYKITKSVPFAVDSNGIRARTSSGEVDVSDIQFSNPEHQKIAESIVQKNYGNRGANALFMNYKYIDTKKLPTRVYIEEADFMYQEGKTFTDMSYEQYLQKRPISSSIVTNLGDKISRAMFLSGQKDALEFDAQQESMRVKPQQAVATTKAKGEYVNNTQNEALLDDTYRATAQKLGVDIERASEIKGNGQFLVSSAKIIVSEKAGNEYNALMHELAEFGLAYDKEGYKEVQNAVRDWWVDKKGAKDLNTLVDAYLDTYIKAEGTKTRKEALDELTNDAIAGLFSSKEGVNDFAEWLANDSGKTQEEQKTIIERIVDFINAVIDKISTVLKGSGIKSTAARTALEMEEKQAKEIRTAFLSVLENASENYKSGQKDNTVNNGVGDNTKIKNSFNTSSNGLANDLLNNYDEELKKIIMEKGGIIVDSYPKLIETVNNAFDEPSKKATVYFGTVDYNVLKKIEDDVPNLPKKLKGNLFKKNKTYSIAMTFDSIRHIINDKQGLTKEDVIEYLDRFPDTILERDSVAYDVYIDSKGKSNNGLLFKKSFNDGLMLTFDIVSNGQKSLKMVTIYMESSAYKKKKSATTPQLQNTVAHTPKAKGGQTSTNSISKSNENVKNSFTVDSDGNTLSEQQQEYFKDSKVRDENGKLLVVYHGTSEDFTVFDREKGRSNMDIQGSFFSPWELDARGYGANVRAFYLNITNPASEAVGYKALRKFQGQNNAGVKARKYLEKLGYDGVNNGNEEYIAFYSNQIKNVDNLNPTDNADIRYSLDVTLSEYNNLVAENEKLKKANEYLRQEMKLTGHRNADIKACEAKARGLKKQLNSNIDTTVLGKMLFDMCQRVQNDKNRSFDSLMTEARSIAEQIADNQKKEISAENKKILDDIRSKGIVLSEAQRAEVAFSYDSYNNFRRANMGRLRLTSDGVPLDTQYSEWMEMYPDLFPDVAEPDQPLVLADLVDTLRNTNANTMGYSRDELIESYTYDIYEAYFDLPARETFADKKQKEINRLKYEYKQIIRDVKQEAKEKYQDKLSQLKQENKDLRQTQAQIRLETRAKARESHEKEKVKSSIRRNMLKLATLSQQTKSKHIPSGLVDSVKNLVECIVFSSKEDIAASNKIFSALSQVEYNFKNAKENKDKYYELANAYDDFIEKQIAEYQKQIGTKSVIDMTLDELKGVEYLLRITTESINNVNKTFNSERYKTVEQAAGKAIDELKKYKKDEIRPFGRSFFYNSMKPEYFFEYLGSQTLLDLYRNVRKGEDTWAVDIYEAKKYADETREKYHWKDWDTKKKYSFVSSFGESLEFSLDELMSIYANSKREQAKGHILGGGFSFGQKEKGLGIKKVRNDNETHRLSETDLIELLKLLSTEQLHYVDDMVEYLSNQVAEKGNQVTKKLYDVELFKEEYYFPIITDSNYMHSESKQTVDTRKIISSGFTNATIDDATNPIRLFSFDEVWAKHCDDMAKYHAFALSLEDFDRVVNYNGEITENVHQSTRVALSNAYGNSAFKYIENLIKDINGGIVARDDGLSILDKAIGKFKKNAVFASASVTIQQPSAICRALSEVDAKYFAQTTISKRDYNELKKYAPIAIIKEMGYFDTNMAQTTLDYLNGKQYKGKERIGALIKDGSYRDEVFSWTASKADELTWCHIWNACKNETKQKHPELSNEDMLKAAGVRFTEVITKTQVYDSVFSRSGMMRSKNGLAKTLTAFMAEPTTSLNMFVNAVIQAKRGTISKKKAAKALGSLVASYLLNAILKSLVTAMRDDDEDKTYLEKYLSMILPNFIDDANPLNQIIFVKDIISAFKGYDVSRADFELINDFIKSVTKMSSENYTVSQKIFGLAGALAAFIDVPFRNIYRDINAAWQTVSNAKDKRFSWSGVNRKFRSEMKETLVIDDIISKIVGKEILQEKSKQQMLYEAILNGDKETEKRVSSQVSNVDKYIKDGLFSFDIRVAEAGIKYQRGDVSAYIDTAKELEADGFDYEMVLDVIKAYSNDIVKAKGYLDENDNEKFAKIYLKLSSSGIDETVLDNAIDSVEIEKSESDKESKLYSSEDLYNAIENGQSEYINTIIESNKSVDIANGKTQEDAEKAIKSIITSLYKEKYLQSDSSKRKEIESKLSKTKYLSADDYKEWVADSYNSEKMVEVFQGNNTAEIQKYVSERIAAKKAIGMTEKKAISNLKSSITTQYKDEYLNGNADERATIITYMQKTGIYGDRNEVRAYISEHWEK